MAYTAVSGSLSQNDPNFFAPIFLGGKNGPNFFSENFSGGFFPPNFYFEKKSGGLAAGGLRKRISAWVCGAMNQQLCFR